ncbi:hypothetical protein ACS0TY_031566 [Phlomoides rotata]
METAMAVLQRLGNSPVDSVQLDRVEDPSDVARPHRKPAGLERKPQWRFKSKVEESHLRWAAAGPKLRRASSPACEEDAPIRASNHKAPIQKPKALCIVSKQVETKETDECRNGTLRTRIAANRRRRPGKKQRAPIVNRKNTDEQTLFSFWLCEHTNLVRPVNEVGFPSFLKWDLNDLEKQHKLLKLTDLEAKFVGPLKLKTSTREQKQFEKLLHYWKEHNMITETQSTDDNQDTQDMPSLENEKNHSLSDPTQTSSGSGGEFNLTPELGMPLEKDPIKVAVCYGMKNDEMNKLILQVDEFQSMILEKDNKIEQLKENLSRVENGFNGRLKEEEEKHER